MNRIFTLYVLPSWEAVAVEQCQLDGISAIETLIASFI